MGKRVTLEQEKEMALLYNAGQSTTKIGKKLGFWNTSILNALNRQGVKIRSKKERHRRRFINFDTFETINTPEKAYWLGFLYADGYNNEKAHQFSLRLAIKDKNHVEKFNIFMGSSYKICIYTGRKYPSCGVNMTSEKLSQDLAKNGCFQNKSLTLKFPTPQQVPEFLIWHFIRGYFDGDGSIDLNDYAMSIATSKFFAISLKDFCSKNDIDCYVAKHKNQNCHYFRIGQRFEFAKFFENLYKSSENLRLERKHERYEKTIKRLDKQIEKMYNHLKLRNIIK